MSLLVIGTLAYDSVETVSERRENQLGGSAVFFAMAARHFARVSLVGVVGNDFKKQDVEMLERAGVDLAGLEIQKGATFRWSGRYEADWNTRHTLDTQLNVFEHFDPKIPTAQTSSKFVFLANAEPRIQAKVLDQISKPRFTMLDTMNLWIKIARDDLLHVLRRVDAVVLNDEEARMLTGESNTLRAAGHVLGLGPRYVIIKKGEHGAFVLGGDVHFSLPAYPVEAVVDPTGAGDSFAGGFMGYLTERGAFDPKDLRKAMVYGTITASYCVEGFSVDGLRERSRLEIEERYNDLLSIVTV